MKRRVNIPRKPAKVALTPRQKAAIEATRVAEQKRREIEKREHAKRSIGTAWLCMKRAWQAALRGLKFVLIVFLTQWSGR